jgi:hypothetical protein
LGLNGSLLDLTEELGGGEESGPEISAFKDVLDQVLALVFSELGYVWEVRLVEVVLEGGLVGSGNLVLPLEAVHLPRRTLNWQLLEALVWHVVAWVVVFLNSCRLTASFARS